MASTAIPYASAFVFPTREEGTDGSQLWTQIRSQLERQIPGSQSLGGGSSLPSESDEGRMDKEGRSLLLWEATSDT